MISRGGDVKVMDFGIAKAAARATRTATGTLKGKMAYMAPEQAGGRDVDARCDQFALGVVLWECLSGRRLFEAGSDLELLKRVMDCDVPRLADVRADVPPELEGAVMRCLSRERDDRFGNLSELEAALRDFRWSLGPKGAVQLGELVEVAAPAPTQPASRRTQPLPAVARRTQPLPPSEGGDPAATRPQASTPADDWTTPDAPSDLARERTTAPVGGPPAVRAQTLSLSPSAADQPPADDRLPSVDSPAPAEQPGREAAGDSGVVSSRRRPVLRGLVAAGLGAVLAAAGLAGWLSLRGRPAVETRAVAPVVQGLARPPPAGPRLRVDSEPPGASLFEDGLDTGLTTPVEVPAPKPGGSFLLELRLPGRRTWQWPVTAADAGKVLRASLEPEPAPVATTIPAGAAAVAAEPRARAVPPPPAHRPARADEPRAAAPPAAPRAMAAAAPAPAGFLSLRSSGAWVDVYVGRRKLGTTPVVHAEVPSGRVRLRLVNSLAGIERTVEIDVAPDKELRYTFNADAP